LEDGSGYSVISDDENALILDPAVVIDTNLHCDLTSSFCTRPSAIYKANFIPANLHKIQFGGGEPKSTSTSQKFPAVSFLTANFADVGFGTAPQIVGFSNETLQNQVLQVKPEAGTLIA
jgi:hypothetical protein